MKRVVWIERDGGIFQPRNGIDGHAPRFQPGVITALSAIARNTTAELTILVRPEKPSASHDLAGGFLEAVLLAEGINVTSMPVSAFGELIDAHLTDCDRERSCFVGTSADLLQGAARLGVPVFSLDIADGSTTESAPSWSVVRARMIALERRAVVERTTKETSVALDISVYGSGSVSVDTGLGFFDHMLDLFFTHAGFDVRLKAKGDLHVDEHHLVEDVGITIGEALRTAIGEKRGMSRYGFLLPMDESLATIAIDLAGRAAFEWKVEFRREKIGDVPTEMFSHFFKSLSDGLRCALHISVEGENEHHKAEAIFKGVGRALRQATSQDPRQTSIPSTKGVL
jgi:imidazoleglycerol-phosphate dehydratase/histidinol-phosphatase